MEGFSLSNHHCSHQGLKSCYSHWHEPLRLKRRSSYLVPQRTLSKMFVPLIARPDQRTLHLPRPVRRCSAGRVAKKILPNGFRNLLKEFTLRLQCRHQRLREGVPWRGALLSMVLSVEARGDFERKQKCLVAGFRARWIPGIALITSCSPALMQHHA